MATSCSESDIIEKIPANSKNKIQVVARVMPFADHDVSSRAIKEGEETNIVSIWLAIFNGQKCENLLDDSDTVFENVKQGIEGKKKAVVLQHDTKKFSIDAVESIILWGKENGYVFLPLNVHSFSSHHKVLN